MWSVEGEDGFISLGALSLILFPDFSGYEIVMVLILVVISLYAMSWRPVLCHIGPRIKCRPPFVSR